MRCSAAPGSRAAANASFSTGFAASEPSAQARLMRVSSWNTTRPAPMLRWPTSEFPICPSGRPTGLARRLEARPGALREQRVEIRRARLRDGVAGTGLGQAEPVHDDEAGRQR